jgi:hypothetical protein
MSDEKPFSVSVGNMLVSQFITIGLTITILWNNLDNFAAIFNNPAIAHLSFWSVVGLSYLLTCLYPSNYKIDLKE